MGKALNMQGKQAAWLAFSLCGIAALHLLFFFTDWYARGWHLDSVSHFLGGAWLAAFAGQFFFAGGRVRATAAYEATILLSFAAFIGVLWEMHEFVADSFITDTARIMQTSVTDTVSDLFFDMLGATMTVILRYAHFLWKNRQDHSS